MYLSILSLLFTQSGPCPDACASPYLVSRVVLLYWTKEILLPLIHSSVNPVRSNQDWIWTLWQDPSNFTDINTRDFAALYVQQCHIRRLAALYVLQHLIYCHLHPVDSCVTDRHCEPDAPASFPCNVFSGILCKIRHLPHILPTSRLYLFWLDVPCEIWLYVGNANS